MSAIYEYAASDIFTQLQSSPRAAVSVSFFELSGEVCSDMLNMFEPAQLLTGRDGSVHAFPLVEVKVTTAEDLIALINHGRAVRTTASTGVNDTSSRSHAILKIYVSPGGEAGGSDEGVLTLVDLAGSEHRIDSMYHGAERRKEGAMINASLMALKECVRARASGKNFSHQYRKNKLTMALKSSFMNPSAQTVIIATVSPASKDTEHSLNTLRHACIMDGQQSSAGDEETRFITGGVKEIELIGEVDVSGISRQRRQDSKQGNASKHDAKISNGNEFRPDEKVLTEKEKSRMRRAAEKKAFANLSREQKILLRDCRHAIGRNPVQEARLSRCSVDDMPPAAELCNGNVAEVSSLPEGRYLGRSGGEGTVANRPTEHQEKLLVDMGFKNPENPSGNVTGRLVHSPLSTPRRLSPFRRSVSSPVSSAVGADTQEPNPGSTPPVVTTPRSETMQIPKEKVLEFKRLQAAMFAEKEVPFDIIKRQFVNVLKQMGFTNAEIKALVIAQTQMTEAPSNSNNRGQVHDDQFRGESESIPGHNAVRAQAMEPDVVSKGKVSEFKKLKASVFHGAQAGTPPDILLRQLIVLLKQKDFTKREISVLVKDLKELPPPEKSSDNSPLRNSASAGSIRRAVAQSTNELASLRRKRNSAEGDRSVDTIEFEDRKSKPTRLSRRSVLWRPPPEDSMKEGVVPAPRPAISAEYVPKKSTTTSNDNNISSEIDETQSELYKLAQQIESPSISEATKFGLKKRMAALKATALRAERKAAQEHRERIASQKQDCKPPNNDRSTYNGNRPTSSQRSSGNQVVSSTQETDRLRLVEPQHLQSIRQPDILDKYTEQLSRGEHNIGDERFHSVPSDPQDDVHSSPQHVLSRRDDDCHSCEVGDNCGLQRVRDGGRRKKGYVGAVSAPFANEMNWNLYM